MKQQLENILHSVKYEHKGLEEGYDKILSLFENKIDECKDEIVESLIVNVHIRALPNKFAQDIISIIKNKLR